MSLSGYDGQDDLNVDSSNWDILHEIDKFLEGYSSDGEELPVNNKNNVLDKCESPVHHKKNELDVGKTLIAINKSDLVNEISTKSNDIEYIGKKPAIFELLEDHEQYAVYDHNPDEANWNVFYKTLPPEEQKHSVKQEPGTDDINGNFNTYELTSETNTQNKLKTFSFCLENLWKRKNQPFNIKREPIYDTEADITNKINSPLHFCEASNPEKDTHSKDKPVENITNDSFSSYDTSTNNILDNFSFLSNFENQKSNDFEHRDPHISTEIGIQNQDTVIVEENSSKDLTSSLATQEDILKSRTELENFSFSLDNINKFQSSAAVNPFFKNSSTTEVFAFNQPLSFDQIYNSTTLTNSDQSNNEFTNICNNSNIFDNGKIIENKEKVLQINDILVSPQKYNNTKQFNFNKTQHISDNTIKSKNRKTWVPFKRYNYSDFRDQQQNLFCNFQDNRKHKKKSFAPQQFKKNFNKLQSDRSRFYKQPYNEDFFKDFKQPVNTIWRGKNNFSQNHYKQIKPYRKKSINCETKSSEIKPPQPIINFQMPSVPINKTCKSNHSWNLPVLSTGHSSDDVEAQNVDEKNSQSVSLNSPNEFHTYRHNSAAVNPYSNNTPELFSFNQPLSFDQINNSTSIMSSDKSNSEYTNTCKNANKVFDNGKSIDNKEELLQTNDVLFPSQNFINTKHFNVNKTQHIISDYLSPESLVGCTIKFTSRKLANTITRDQLIEALALYGEIEHSWWTPDDFFFCYIYFKKNC